MKKWIALFCMASLPASAFIFVKSDNTYTYAKGERKIANAPLWSSKVVNFYVNTDLTALGGGNFPAAITGSELLSAAQVAAGVWNSINCRTGITVKVIGTTTGTFSTADSQNVVAYDDRAVGASYCGSASQLACAGSAIVSDRYVDCDISINGSANLTVDNSGSGSSYHLTTTLIHEMGHCLGIDHTYQTATVIYSTLNTYLLNSIMKPALSAGTSQTSLNQDEKDALQCIYPKVTDSKRDACGSYHGTNGNGEISGTVSGGPSGTYTPECTNDSGEAATSTLQNGSDSSGCITSAFAESDFSKNSNTSQGHLFFRWAETWVPMFGVLAWLLYRRRRLHG